MVKALPGLVASRVAGTAGTQARFPVKDTRPGGRAVAFDYAPPGPAAGRSALSNHRGDPWSRAPVSTRVFSSGDTQCRIGDPAPMGQAVYVSGVCVRP
jgi:hypothetical protein